MQPAWSIPGPTSDEIGPGTERPGPSTEPSGRRMGAHGRPVTGAADSGATRPHQGRATHRRSAMRTSRFINAGLGVAAACGALAGPAAAVPALDDGPGNGASAAIAPPTRTATRVRSLSRRPGPCTHSRSPRSPRWTTAGRSPSRRPGRCIPRSSRPRPRPPAPPATLVAHHSASSFDWGAAAIGAATTLAVLAIVLAAAVAIRRWRVGPPPRLT